MLFDHLALQVGVRGFQHVDQDRAMFVLADKERVGLDDGVESGPITIHLPAVDLREQLVFRRVKQKIRLQ